MESTRVETGNIMEGRNIFIEFEIIKLSNPIILYKELDILIATGKLIFVWSKMIPPVSMRAHCLQTKIEIPKEEEERHETAYRMRYEGASYKDIAEATQIPVKQLGWYISTKPGRHWALDDWIADYYLKDSAIYAKVDAVIDCNEQVVAKFKRRGIPGNVLAPLK